MMPTNFPRQSILMADDEAPIRRIFVEIIESVFPEIEIETAFDGLDCIEKCKKRKYDLLFLNIVMPRANGIAVLEFLKKSHSTMPVWVMSGSYFGQESEDKIRALGGRGIIAKPPDLDRLIAVVELELKIKAAVFG